eukprot:TRINITY_DN7788_c0_g1_i1.p1 TRINITY_DN7788_c0_g1~~TRINITY_DN7788_c0_g1_i1.p1  ORF type:complete len:647 (+),score=84.58 TRINITY_DN7788_c0_g1_i1:24-1964(+)
MMAVHGFHMVALWPIVVLIALTALPAFGITPVPKWDASRSPVLIALDTSASEIYFFAPDSEEQLREPMDAAQVGTFKALVADRFTRSVYIVSNNNGVELWKLDVANSALSKLGKLNISNPGSDDQGVSYSASRRALYMSGFSWNPGYRVNINAAGTGVTSVGAFDLETESSGYLTDISIYDTGSDIAYYVYYDPEGSQGCIQDSEEYMCGELSSPGACAVEPASYTGFVAGPYSLVTWPHVPMESGFGQTNLVGWNPPPFEGTLRPIDLEAVSMAQFEGDRRVMLWVTFSDGIGHQRYLYDPAVDSTSVQLQSPSSAGNYTLTDVAYLPGTTTLTPPPPSGSVVSTAFSGAGPVFTYTNSHNDLSESTSVEYSAFQSAGATFAFPDQWNLVQESFEMGMGSTTAGVSFEPKDGSGQTYAYTYTSSQYQSQNISFTFTSLTNQDTSLYVQASESSPRYQLAKEAVKFGLHIYGDGVSAMFNGSSTLTWQSCFLNNQKQGQLDISDYDTIEADSISTYRFYRVDRTDTSTLLTLVVPTQCVADDALVDAPHLVSVSASSTDAKICVQLSFPYFSSSLHYDPDLSVLSSSSSGSDGDDNLAVKIAVPVVLGTACLCVCFIIIVGTIIAAYVTHTRRKKFHRAGSAIAGL